MTTRIIPPRVPFIDGRSGLIAREWYLYFLSLAGDVQDLETGLVGLAPLPISVTSADIAAVVQDSLSLAPPVVPAVAAASGGATPNGTATVTVAGLAGGSIEWTETVAAPGLTTGSLVFVQLAPPDNTLENDPEMLDIAAMAAACTADNTVTVTMAFSTPTRGPIPLLYGVM